MQGISDIKIVGIDETRPPRVRKEPYIDLAFKLSHPAPPDWCEDFNGLTGKMDPSVKIEKKERLFIETYVREMSQIQQHLNKIKQKIATCNEQYIANIQQKAMADAEKNASLQGDGGKQGALNTIIATLNFDD